MAVKVPPEGLDEILDRCKFDGNGAVICVFVTGDQGAIDVNGN